MILLAVAKEVCMNLFNLYHVYLYIYKHVVSLLDSQTSTQSVRNRGERTSMYIHTIAYAYKCEFFLLPNVYTKYIPIPYSVIRLAKK